MKFISSTSHQQKRKTREKTVKKESDFGVLFLPNLLFGLLLYRFVISNRCLSLIKGPEQPRMLKLPKCLQIHFEDRIKSFLLRSSFFLHWIIFFSFSQCARSSSFFAIVHHCKKNGKRRKKISSIRHLFHTVDFIYNFRLVISFQFCCIQYYILRLILFYLGCRIVNDLDYNSISIFAVGFIQIFQFPMY